MRIYKYFLFLINAIASINFFNQKFRRTTISIDKNEAKYYRYIVYMFNIVSI